MSDAPVISPLGTTALLFEAPGLADLAAQQRIWQLAAAVCDWPELREAVPGVHSLMLVLRHPPRDQAPLEARLRAAWEHASAVGLEGRVVELPVVYGGPGGPHLADVVAHTGLSAEAVAQRHAAATYPVLALGSHPGYCYLGGMDPALATPRRPVPVLRLPGGAVSIGGGQTGVSASDGPSGWNTIGTTSLRFFDPGRSPPALLRPGDVIRFRIERILPMIAAP